MTLEYKRIYIDYTCVQNYEYVIVVTLKYYSHRLSVISAILEKYRQLRLMGLNYEFCWLYTDRNIQETEHFIDNS
jgi:hypothetical protein